MCLMYIKTIALCAYELRLHFTDAFSAFSCKINYIKFVNIRAVLVSNVIH